MSKQPRQESDQLVRVGITGHTRLTEHSTQLVYDALLLALQPYSVGALRGVTCLAEGADQIFARAVLAARGTYEVVLPSRDYRLRCISPSNVASFDRLLDHAVTVSYACPGTCGGAAYAAANAELLRRSNYLLAVWDGQRVGGAGGTAELVALAEQSGVPVARVWPTGARRA
jgi:hypothetical protein